MHNVLTLNNKKTLPLSSVEISLETQGLVVIFEVWKDYKCADVYFYSTGRTHFGRWLYLDPCVSQVTMLDGPKMAGGKQSEMKSSFHKLLIHPEALFLWSSLPNTYVFWEIWILLSMSLFKHFWVCPSKLFFSKWCLRQSARFQWKLLL